MDKEKCGIYTIEYYSAIKRLNPAIYLFFKRFYLFIFRERGWEGEREGEKCQCVVTSCLSPTGDLACNPGMCPDWESNQWPFGLQAGAQSTEPHQPGLKPAIYDNMSGP